MQIKHKWCDAFSKNKFKLYKMRNFLEKASIIQYEINLHNQTKKCNSCKLNTSGVMHLIRTNSNIIKRTTFGRRYHSFPYKTFYDLPQGLHSNNIFS